MDTVAATETPSPSAPPRRSRRRRWLRAAVRAVALFVLSLAGAGLIITTFGAQHYHWRAFEMEVGIVPAMQGQTRLLFAPLGEVRAPTHSTPIALNIGLQSISF